MDSEHALAEQYGHPGKLDARIALHLHHSTASEPWHAFVRRHLRVTPEQRVLEIGCGSGALWAVDGPTPRRLTLTDRSSAMVATAAGVEPGAAAACCDAASLPFRDDAFDLVVANHVLYHVPDVYHALAEIRRVLAPGGRLVAATNGGDHMRELDELATVHLGVPSYRPEVSPGDFWLETAGDLLPAFFPDHELHLHEDAIEVADPAPAVAYALSLLSDDERARVAIRVPALTSAIQRQIDAHGVFRARKSSGVFEARVPRAEEVRPRRAARVIVIDEDDSVLLLEGESGDGRRTFWICPGGGLRDGESDADAARRELREETGIDADPGPAVWTRIHEFRMPEGVIAQHETYFVARVARGTPVAPHRADPYVRGHRWWTLPEIRVARQAFAPRRLAQLLPAVLAGELPDTPLDVGP